jgi:glutamate--cysteine ligase
VPRSALRTPLRRSTVLEIARAALAIAQGGLQRRARRNAQGQDEAIFLEPVEAILAEGVTPADDMLARYEKDWGRSTAPLFKDYAF